MTPEAEANERDALMGAAHVLCRSHNRFDDLLVARTAANIAVHEML
jgi:hypothetical protein